MVFLMTGGLGRKHSGLGGRYDLASKWISLIIVGHTIQCFVG